MHRQQHQKRVMSVGDEPHSDLDVDPYGVEIARFGWCRVQSLAKRLLPQAPLVTEHDGAALLEVVSWNAQGLNGAALDDLHHAPEVDVGALVGGTVLACALKLTTSVDDLIWFSPFLALCKDNTERFLSLIHI